jgi:hypothetical protein
MHDPIPLLCDRCRAEGVAGEPPFADMGDLLDFEPVPRRPRADGWDAEVQRAYILALAATGSKRQAVLAVGKSPFGVDQLMKVGVDQLMKAKGSEGFNAASERALAIAADNKSRRLAEGLGAVAAAARLRPPGPAWAKAATRRHAPALPEPEAEPEAEPGPAALSEEQEEVRFELLLAIVGKYLLKLQEERRSRLEGRIAEADLYLRQVTMLEVAMDVTSGDGMALLRDARLGGFDLLAVAETEVSKLLDDARRRYWAECGDPPRPDYPPRHLLVERQEGFAVEPLPLAHPLDKDRQREQDEGYARDAHAQIEWEALARRDYERRRDSAAES